MSFLTALQFLLAPIFGSSLTKTLAKKLWHLVVGGSRIVNDHKVGAADRDHVSYRQPAGLMS